MIANEKELDEISIQLYEIIQNRYPDFVKQPHFKQRNDSKPEDVIQGVDTSLWTNVLTLPIVCDILLFMGSELNQKNLQMIFFTKKMFDGDENILAVV